MKNVLLMIESVILLVICFTWCFSLQHNFDILQQENIKLKKELYEVQTSTEREINLMKHDIKISEVWRNEK